MLKNFTTLSIAAALLSYNITSAQSVGVNTDKPGSTLDVNGSLAAKYSAVTSASYAMTSTDFYISYNGTTNATFTLPASISGTGNFKGRMYTIKNNTVFSITVDAAGSETINGGPSITVAANQSAQIINTGLTGVNKTWEAVVTSNNVTNVTAGNGLNVLADNVRLGGTLSQATTITNNGNVLNLTGSASTTTFAANGNVGLGTTAPTSNLHIVAPNFGSYGGFKIEDNSGANAAYFTITPGYLGSTECGTCVTLDYGGSGTIGFVDQIAPTLDNNWSIGTASLRWRALYAANGTIQTSDIRLKKNIQNTQYGLASVMKMRPVEYEWKDGKGSHMVGFIAQEMEKIVPEAVETPKSKKEYYGMSYNQLIPVLTKAIQEQQIIIDELRSELKEIKEKVGL